MMKKLYTEGDDDMKRMINKAWVKLIFLYINLMIRQRIKIRKEERNLRKARSKVSQKNK